MLEEIIFDKEVSCIVVIDQNSDELENVLSQLTIKTDIIEFQTFSCDGELIHKFEPFQGDVKVDLPLKNNVSVDELDTIIIPAREEGFNEVFLGENCRYAIRMSSSMIKRIKFIAAYQVSPISAITYYAEVANIEKYNNTNKYIVHFKEAAKEIGPIKLPKDKPNIAPQALRYTNFNKLKTARSLIDVF